MGARNKEIEKLTYFLCDQSDVVEIENEVVAMLVANRQDQLRVVEWQMEGSGTKSKFDAVIFTHWRDLKLEKKRIVDRN